MQSDTVDSALNLANQGRPDQAQAILRRLLQASPTDIKALTALGMVLMHARDAVQAEYHLGRACSLSPQTAGLHSDHANALFALGRLDDAIAGYRRALALDPNYWQASLGLVQALTRTERPEEAAALAQETFARHPRLHDAYDMGARALLLAGRTDEAVAMSRRGLAIAPTNGRLWTTMAVAMTYSDSADPAELAGVYRQIGLGMAAAAPPPPRWTNPPDKGRPLRVGYFSPDLREHSVAHFVEPILEHHDAAAVESVCYFAGAADAVTARLRGMAHKWVDAAGQRPDLLLQRIRDDRVDILVELSGHSMGNQLPLLARRGAPVQVTYIGWPTTTGLPSMDWRIVDAVTDPPGAEAMAVERLYRLDGCFLCYKPPAGAPEPGSAARTGPPTFGSFNAAFKIGPRTIALWSRVLLASPGSRLLMKATGLTRDGLRAHVLAQFAAHGIGPERLELVDRVPDTAGHLRVYERVDVALDTFPYNGTTTTCEALWMGVPVVTLRGGVHASRVGASLLGAVGLGEFVAGTEDEFVATAAALGADRARLSALRRDLRPRLAASPLCDGRAFTRRLEAAYRDMWAAWCDDVRA